MKPEELIQMLQNKLTALEDKKKAAFKKGAIALYEIFNNQIADISLTLESVKKGVEGYTEKEKERIKQTVIDNLPNLAFYVRKKSIHKAVSDSIDKALI